MQHNLIAFFQQLLIDDKKGKMVNSDGNQKFIEVRLTSLGLGKQDGTTKEAFINLR
jgi:hypothetical protein